jgi:spore coat protein CotF
MSLQVKDMIADLLHTEKSLSKAYCTVELECANQSLRQSLRNMQLKTQENHAKFFHEMHTRGWYKTPVAGQQAIESTIISWEQKFLKNPELNPDAKH